MNFPGRIVGGLLVAIATLWILGIAGVFPFSNRAANQVAANADRTPVSDPNAQRFTTPATQTGANATQSGTQPQTSAQADGTNDSTSTAQSGTGTSTFNSGTSNGTSQPDGTVPATDNTVPATGSTSTSSQPLRAAW